MCLPEKLVQIAISTSGSGLGNFWSIMAAWSHGGWVGSVSWGKRIEEGSGRLKRKTCPIWTSENGGRRGQVGTGAEDFERQERLDLLLLLVGGHLEG